MAAVVDSFTVSPKLANSGVQSRVRLRWTVLEQFAAMGRGAFKFVVAEPSDLDEVSAIAERLALSTVMVMPEGNEAAELDEAMRMLAPEVARRGCRGARLAFTSSFGRTSPVTNSRVRRY